MTIVAGRLGVVIRAVSFGCALAVLVASCSSRPSGSGTISFDPNAFARLEAEHPEIRAMPDLDLTYILAGSFGPDEVVLRQVEARERAKCLQGQGFDVPEDVPAASVTWDAFSIYRKLDSAFVKAAGYGIVLRTSPTPPESTLSAIDRYVSDLSEQQKQTFGVADAECSSELQTLLFDDFERWDRLREELERVRNDYILLLQGSDPIQALNREWAACMGKRGFSHSGPDSVMDDLAALATEGKLDLQTELATAAADLDCRAELRFEERYWELYQVGEVTLVEKNAQLIEDVRHAKYDKVLAMVAAPTGSATS